MYQLRPFGVISKRKMNWKEGGSICSYLLLLALLNFILSGNKLISPTNTGKKKEIKLEGKRFYLLLFVL